MADDQSEEFKKFILDNREIIERILNEGKEEEREKDVREEFEERITAAKAKAKGAGDAVFDIIGNDDVQKHLITGCLEFIHFFEAVIKAAPLSPEAREAVERMEQTRDSAIRNVVAVGAKDKMDNMKTEEPKAESKSASERIEIRDLSSENPE